jgi:hypothetical protein
MNTNIAATCRVNRLDAPMNESEFLQRMELADQELAQNQVPIHARTFHAFRLLASDYAGPLIGYSVRSEEYPEFVGPNRFCQLSRQTGFLGRDVTLSPE